MKKRINNLTFLVSSFMIGFGLAWFWEKTTMKIGRFAHQGGWHFHHSLFGIFSPFLMFAIWRKNWFKNKTNLILLTIGLSSGVITQHTIGDGFRFITKD